MIFRVYVYLPEGRWNSHPEFYGFRVSTHFHQPLVNDHPRWIAPLFWLHRTWKIIVRSRNRRERLGREVSKSGDGFFNARKGWSSSQRRPFCGKLFKGSPIFAASISILSVQPGPSQPVVNTIALDPKMVTIPQNQIIQILPCLWQPSIHVYDISDIALLIWYHW